MSCDVFHLLFAVDCNQSSSGAVESRRTLHRECCMCMTRLVCCPRLAVSIVVYRMVYVEYGVSCLCGVLCVHHYIMIVLHRSVAFRWNKLSFLHHMKMFRVVFIRTQL